MKATGAPSQAVSIQGKNTKNAVCRSRRDTFQILQVDALDKQVHQSRRRSAQIMALAAVPGVATQTERVGARRGT